MNDLTPTTDLATIAHNVRLFGEQPTSADRLVADAQKFAADLIAVTEAADSPDATDFDPDAALANLTASFTRWQALAAPAAEVTANASRAIRRIGDRIESGDQTPADALDELCDGARYAFRQAFNYDGPRASSPAMNASEQGEARGSAEAFRMYVRADRALVRSAGEDAVRPHDLALLDTFRGIVDVLR